MFPKLFFQIPLYKKALQKTYVHAKVHSWLAVTYPLQKLISTNSTTFDNHKKDNYFRIGLSYILTEFVISFAFFDEQNAPLCQ
ncbi:hypothetical protein T03_7245 [Trichinella britovi]|uniref:Uncharacterized protein n=1 Tax=Trichinella britovi TaxID=45882 RepID=A0A0V1D5Y1_TRIBR|nr:hypothetical protein T03_7245 [Trichinella britovi]